MDTSDSEYFESADEDVQSSEDEEQAISQKFDEKLKRNEENDDLKSSEDKKIDEPKIESNLVSAVETMDIKCQGPSDLEQVTEIKNSQEEIKNPEDGSENSTLTENESITSSDKPFKKSKIHIKSKIGCKTTKNPANFEEKPENVMGAVENLEPVEKQVARNTEKSNIIEEGNLWDDDELDWGSEAKVENQTSFQSSSSVDYKRTTNIESSPVDYKNTANNESSSLGYKKTTNNETQNRESDSWSSWSNWGVSVLSTATQSVSSITTQITNVIESGLGAVDPEELARIEKEEKKKSKNETIDLDVKLENANSNDSTYGSFGLENLVKLVENTGTKVISGGLDTLESIGKKTMEVLQEGDPGLKKKRAFLKIDQDKPVLSQILREAKERAETESKSSGQSSTKKWKNYETLFDDHHGLVHLEALELLSKQCEIKLKNVQSSLNGDEFTDFSETMDQIKELCELPDEDDEEQLSIDEIKQKLEKAVSEINIPITYEKLVANWEETEIWLSTIDLDICDEKEVHQQAIETLAEMTSRAMEQFHKTGELLLIKERRSTADEADSLVQITATLISMIGIVAAKFCEKLNSKVANNKEGLITNVFFEAANSSSYIQDALHLLIPVLQVGAT